MDVLLRSLADSTIKQYNSALRKWLKFCTSQMADPYNPDETDVLDFLNTLVKEGSSYGTINNARSAVVLIAKNKLSDSCLISRFMKGVFRLNPGKTKYDDTWDVSPVLIELES